MTYENLSFGNHTFAVRSTDPFGNVDPTPESRSFTIPEGAVASASGTTLTFQAAPGDANQLTIGGGGCCASYFLTEEAPGVPLLAGSGCNEGDGTSLACDGFKDSVVLNLGDGNDTATDNLNVEPVTMNGGAGNDNLNGGGGDDALNGGGGDAGMDRLSGGYAGNDTFDGGPGIDRALYTSSGFNGINIAIDNVANDVDGTGGIDNVLDNVESVTGSSGDDQITGSCFANTLAGQDGNDTLNGDPVTCGVYGGDFMGGGDGGDTYTGRGGTDQVSYTANADFQPIDVSLNGVADDYDGRGANDNIGQDIEYVHGSPGDDVIDASGATQGVSLWGRAGNDTLIGSPFNDFLRGEAGADTLDCAGGANDMYTVDPADTSVTNCETPG